MKEQELFWKYAAGECTPQEAELLNKRLNADKALQKELQLVKATHDFLKQMPLEKPSMRFAKNVMEAIQEQALVTGNLISLSVLKKLIGGLVLVSLAIYLIFSKTPGSVSEPLLVRDTLHKLNDFLALLPAKTVFYLFSTVAVIMLLFVADRLIGERMLHSIGHQRPRN